MPLRNNRSRMNNKGTSLIELLIAVTIISVVAAGFFSAFIMSARINAKSKIQHKATSLAQNIVEGLKAEDMDKIIQQFKYPSYVETVDGESQIKYNFDLLSTNILSRDSRESLAKNVGVFESTSGQYGVSADGGKTFTYTRTTDGKYYLFLRNLMMENTSFDALITIDNSAYTKEGSSSNYGGQDFNDQELIRIQRMDINFDAIAANSIEYDAEVMAMIGVESGILLSDLERIITIKIEKDEYASGNKQYKVHAVYEYKTSKGVVGTFTDIIYDNKDNLSKELRNIYVFFQPQFDWKSEKIILENDNATPLNLYVIKQQVSSDGMLLEKDKNDISYKVNIDVREVNLSKSNVTVSSNLGYSLIDGSKIVGNNQAIYSFNGTVDSSMTVNSLVNKAATDKLLDVTVDIYETGSDVTATNMNDFLENIVGDKKATMNGTIRN